MLDNKLSGCVRSYLMDVGLDFSNYGSIFIKEGIMYMLEKADIVYSKQIYEKLSLEYNKEIDTIKKGIRSSINNALLRGVLKYEGNTLEKISTRKALVMLYEGFIKKYGYVYGY